MRSSPTLQTLQTLQTLPPPDHSPLFASIRWPGQAGLTSAGSVAAGSDGCLLGRIHFPCGYVEQESAHPDAAFIITGDFNKANFKTIAPKYFQHVTINTRGDRTLDHCYSPLRDAYKSLPRPPFGKSDHSSVLLLPAYRQKLKREAPALRTVHCWSDQSDAILQDCFDHVDWDMFRAASDDDIEAYSDTVTCFIRKCIDDVVPTKTIRIYPNQKPWINSDVRSALSARTSAYKSGNTDDRKQASYDLRRSIKAAK